MKNNKLTNKLYFLKCPDTLEIRYIGITCKDNINDRLSSHISKSKIEKTHKANWIKKLISENKRPLIELILDNLTYEESLLREIEYIKKYKEEGVNLLNITEGGDFNPAYLDSVKEKIKNHKLGKPISDEVKEKIRISTLGEKNHFFNKKHKQDSKEKMSESIKKVFSNNEMIEKLSELKNSIKKPLIQYTLEGNFIKEWDSISRIKRELGYDKKTIGLACKGKYKQAYGFLWKYKIQ